MVRTKLWKAGLLLKPTQPRLRAESAEDLACEMVKMQRREQKAKARLKLLLKHSVGALADEDFNRMHSEATEEIAQDSLAITGMKAELKRRGIKL